MSEKEVIAPEKALQELAQISQSAVDLTAVFSSNIELGTQTAYNIGGPDTHSPHKCVVVFGESDQVDPRSVQKAGLLLAIHELPHAYGREVALSIFGPSFVSPEVLIQALLSRPYLDAPYQVKAGGSLWTHLPCCRLHASNCYPGITMVPSGSEDNNIWLGSPAGKLLVKMCSQLIEFEESRLCLK